MKNLKIIIIAFLTGITIFSVFQYVSSLRQLIKLRADLRQTEERITALEQDRQNLTVELNNEKQIKEQLAGRNLILKDYARHSSRKMRKLNTELLNSYTMNESLTVQISLLRSENNSLRTQQEESRSQLLVVMAEKEALEKKMSSILELKNAIRELKKKMRTVVTVVSAPRQVFNGMPRPEMKSYVIDGNHGFLLKGGKATYPAKVKIEVTQTQAVQ